MTRALVLSAWVAAAAAAQEVTLRGPDRELMVVGTEAVLVLAVDGVRDDVRLGGLPSVEGLEILAGPPARSVVQTVEAGRVLDRPRTTWEIGLRPQREGTFDVAPFHVEAGGRSFATGPVRLEAVRELSGDAHAFVEVLADRESVFVHEPVPLRLRVGFDGRFFREQAIATFQQALDLPVPIQASFLEALPGRSATQGEPGSARRRWTLVLGEIPATAVQVDDRVVGGRRFTVVEIERTLLPESSGDLVIPAPAARFAYATRFHEDFLGARTPADRHEAVILGRSFVLRVVALPEFGRPKEFTGAVGRFTIDASAEPREVAIGQSLKLVLRIGGEGDLSHFGPPRLEALEGFHVLGVIEGGSGGARTFTCDIAPLHAQIREVPAVTFAFFDPTGPAGYRTIATIPIPITVRPGPTDATPEIARRSAEGRAVPGVSDIHDLKPVDGGSGGSRFPGTAVLMVSLLAPGVVAVGLRAWVRARERVRNDVGRLRARCAATAFRARVSGPAPAVAGAFAEYLAARLRCPPGSIIAPDLGARLGEAGVPADLAARTVSLLDRLVAAGYGGRAFGGDVLVAGAVVDALEISFESSENAR